MQEVKKNQAKKPKKPAGGKEPTPNEVRGSALAAAHNAGTQVREPAFGLGGLWHTPLHPVSVDQAADWAETIGVAAAFREVGSTALACRLGERAALAVRAMKNPALALAFPEVLRHAAHSGLPQLRQAISTTIGVSRVPRAGAFPERMLPWQHVPWVPWQRVP